MYHINNKCEAAAAAQEVAAFLLNSPVSPSLSAMRPVID